MWLAAAIALSLSASRPLSFTARGHFGILVGLGQIGVGSDALHLCGDGSVALTSGAH
jgi:hypothetical protein